MPAELPAFRSLLLFQNTDISTRALTTNDISAFFSWADRLSRNYAGASHAKHKGYYDQFFNALVPIDQIGPTYIADQYYKYVLSTFYATSRTAWKMHQYWHAYLHGDKIDHSAYDRSELPPGVAIPDNPPHWQGMIAQELSRWGDGLPDYLVDKSSSDFYYNPNTSQEVMKMFAHFRRLRSEWLPCGSSNGMICRN